MNFKSSKLKKLSTVFLMIFAFYSCNKKDAQEIVCDLGFEGTDCKTEIRSKFYGTYAVEQNCSGSSTTVNYNCLISGVTGNINQIKFSDFGNLSTLGATDEFIATIDGNSFVIIEKTFSGLTINGSGNISNNVINVTIEYTGTNFSCTDTYTRQ